MKCLDCNAKMERVNLKMTMYVGPYYYGMVCKTCEARRRAEAEAIIKSKLVLGQNYNCPLTNK